MARARKKHNQPSSSYYPDWLFGPRGFTQGISTGKRKKKRKGKSVKIGKSRKKGSGIIGFW